MLPTVQVVGTGLLAVALAGCANARFLVRSDPTNAAEHYQQAMVDLDGGLYDEALKGFSALKTRYPYTKYAALADLRTADTHRERGKVLEAVDGYRNFLKFHPNHDEAPYAMLQIGEAYQAQIPEDWFFLPPAAEKDQGHTKLAIAAYNDMVARFPDAELTDAAREKLDECRGKLAEHELYVANFYFKRERYKAAAGRAEGLLKAYPNLGHDEEALWIAGISRYSDGEKATARGHLEQLRERFPDGEWAPEATLLLKTLKNVEPPNGS